ncbi:MAG: hypothetical protein RLZZ501_2459, partial [Pseudomonadota bacterium]
MADVPVADAVAQARAALDLPAAVMAEVIPTRRLDRAGSYLLVVFGPPGGAVAVATLDPASGALEHSATLDGGRPFPPVNAAAARRVAGAGPQAPAEAVWLPCRASMSPLYPLWRIEG